MKFPKILKRAIFKITCGRLFLESLTSIKFFHMIRFTAIFFFSGYYLLLVWKSFSWGNILNFFNNLLYLCLEMAQKNWLLNNKSWNLIPTETVLRRVRDKKKVFKENYLHQNYMSSNKSFNLSLTRFSSTFLLRADWKSFYLETCTVCRKCFRKKVDVKIITKHYQTVRGRVCF